MDIDLENLSREDLVELVKRLLERIRLLEAYVVELETENEQLREQVGHKKPPHWVKPKRRKAEEAARPRRERAAQHNHGRRRGEKPTRTAQHAYDRCPECNYRLQGGSIDYTRQTIELPPPQPVEVIEQTGQVLGQGRMGVRLASLIAYLRHTLRLPIRCIQEYLSTIHQLRISIGEIVELLHQVRRSTAEAVEGLKQC